MTEIISSFSDLMALTALEIILGIDNIVFIAIVTSKLPREQQSKARRLGLLLAMGSRILLLLGLNWIKTHGETPLFHLSDLHIASSFFLQDGYEKLDAINLRDIVLFLGGLFLMGKSVYEIHEKMEHLPEVQVLKRTTSFFSVLVQITILDVVFSLDSVITAVGVADKLWVMITAIVIAIGVMMIFANPVSQFVEHNPTIKMLALSFLILIGVMLVAESADAHMNKGYIYFAMAFSLVVEFLNIRLRKKHAAAEHAASSENP
jgi:predicted tellurium resistance membrane protein TerC